jgi:hypothetical protein
VSKQFWLAVYKVLYWFTMRFYNATVWVAWKTGHRITTHWEIEPFCTSLEHYR